MSHCSVGLGTNRWGFGGRPFDLAMTPDGAVLVSDDANGADLPSCLSACGCVAIRSGAIGAAVLIAVASLVAQTRDSTSTDRLAIQALAEKATSANIVVTSSSAAPNGPLPLVHSDYARRSRRRCDGRACRRRRVARRGHGGSGRAGTEAVRALDAVQRARDRDVVAGSAAWIAPASGVGRRSAGRNSRGTIGYFGPRPLRSDPAHYYHFQIFALTEMLSLQPSGSRDALLAALKGRVVATGDLVLTFQAPVNAR
jgi:hypothetical protein